VAGIPKQKLYCRPLCLPVYEDIFINKIDKKRERKLEMGLNNFGVVRT
jgi:hypothetical protein